MKKLLVLILVLAVAAGGVGYWRGWFNVTNDGHVEVHVDKAKFKADKEAFGKTVSEKAKALKTRVASLWEKTEGLTGDDKAAAQKELTELRTRHDRIEQQLRDLDDAGQDRFAAVREDLLKALDEVETKIDETTKKLSKAKDK
jgi:ABC-type phosphate transport system auxiliary subunit